MRRTSTRCSSRAALASLLILVVAAAGCGGGGGGGTSTSTASGTVGPTGGTIAVRSGPLAGASIEVPANALADDLRIRISQGDEMLPATSIVSAVVVASTSTLQAGGLPVAFAPEGATFAAAVTITLPMLPGGLPAGASAQDVIVLFTADGGVTIEALAPAAVDLAHGFVTVATTTLGTFEIAIVIHDSAEASSITLTVAAASISEEGEATDATVARTGDLSRQVVVHLQASPAGVLSIPAQVTILGGQATARFVVQGVDNHLLDGTRAATLTAAVSGATPSAVVIAVVSGDVDEPPVADAIAVSTDEDTSVGGTLTATDVNLQAITFAIVSNGSLGTATVTDASTGAFTYVPTGNANGTDTFTYKATANGADSAAATVTVTIAPVNDAPVGTAGALSVTEDLTSAGVLAATDVENDALTFAVSQQGAKGSVSILDASTGAYQYTPAANTNGADVFKFTASDGTLTSAEQTITVSITAVNDAPVATGGSLSTNEDTAQSGALTASDVDSAISSYAIVSSPAKGTLTLTTATGAFSYTPLANTNGADVFTWRAIDSVGALASNVTSVTIAIAAVNDAPVAAAGSISTSEDTVTTSALVATDVDSAIASYQIVTPPLKGAVSLVTATGAFTFTPGADLNGADSFTWRAVDSASAALSNVATVSISIAPVNDAPVATGGALATNEDTAKAGTLTASDADSSISSYVIVSSPSKGTLSLVTATGSFTYTPLSNTNGADVFTWRAVDSVSAAPSNVTSVTVAITAVNDAPTLAAIGSVSVLEDAGLQQISLTGISRGPADEAGQGLTIVASSGNTTVIPTPSISYAGGATGTLSYTPAADRFGTVTITVTAQDDGGTANGGANTITRTFTVTVTAVNDVPLVSARTYGLARNVTKTVDVASGLLQSGFVSDADPGDVLTAVLFSGPTFGTLDTFNADGSFSYHPPQDVTGTATFQYQVSDGTTLSAVALVSLQISSANSPPTATADGPFSVTEDASLTIPAPGLLTNDVDVDGDTLQAETVTGVPANQGTLTAFNQNGSFTFVPAANFFGGVSFTYRAKDPFGATSSAVTVSINVTSVNDTPSFTVTGGTGLRQLQEDSGANVIDIAAISPGNSFETAAGDTVSFTAILESVAPANLFGGFTVATTGQSSVTTNSITLTPAANVTGTANLRLRATDSFNLSSTDVVIALQVLNVNDPPDFTATTPSAQEDIASAITITGITAGTLEGEPVSVSAQMFSETAPGLVGTLVVVPSGFQTPATNRTITLTPGADLNGSAQIRITATDAGTPASSTSKIVTVVVAPVDDPPDFTIPASNTINEDTVVAADKQISVTGIVPGPANEAGQRVQITVLSSGTPGLVTGATPSPAGLTLSATNTITFTLGADVFGTASITVTATDEGGKTRSRTFALTVSNVDDSPVVPTIAAQTTNEDTTKLIPVTGITAGPGGELGTLTLSVSSSNQALVPNANVTVSPTSASNTTNATITAIPAANATGTATITLTVSDGVSTPTQVGFTLTVLQVNDAPTATAFDLVTRAAPPVEVGDPLLNGAPITFNLQGSDLETVTASCTFSIVSGPSHGALSPSTPGGVTRTYTPNGTFGSSVAIGTSADTFTYRITDANGASATAVVSIYESESLRTTSPVSSLDDPSIAWATPTGGALQGLAEVVRTFGINPDLEPGDLLFSVGSNVKVLRGRSTAQATVISSITSPRGIATLFNTGTFEEIAVVVSGTGTPNGYGTFLPANASPSTAITMQGVTGTSNLLFVATEKYTDPNRIFLASARSIWRVPVNRNPPAGDLVPSTPTLIYDNGGTPVIRSIACRINGDLYFVEDQSLKRLADATTSGSPAVSTLNTALPGTPGGMIINNSGRAVVAITDGSSTTDFLKEYDPVTGEEFSSLNLGTSVDPKFLAVPSMREAALHMASTTAVTTRMMAQASMSLAFDVHPMLNLRGCGDCHNGDGSTTPPPNVLLNGANVVRFSWYRTTPSKMAQATVGIRISGNATDATMPVNNCTNLNLIFITGGDVTATNSFLLSKVTLASPSCGDQMPHGGPYLSRAEVEALRRWILDGANTP